ncbi:MAG: DUF1579 family protein [Terriglobales bacterium]
MRFTCAVLLVCIAVAGVTLAQMEKMTPAPELKKLDYFAGNWTSVGEVKPGPMGPGGKTLLHEHVAWMEGKFFLEIHADYKTPQGNGTEIAFIGYDTQEKMYTYDEFDSQGEAVHAKGTVDGDTWTWTNEMKMGDKTMKTRYTEKVLSPTSYSYKFEMSPDGTQWNLVMDGKDTKNTKAVAKAAASKQ